MILKVAPMITCMGHMGVGVEGGGGGRRPQLLHAQIVYGNPWFHKPNFKIRDC